MPPLITLTTDFGYTDHYVGAMKGVIAGICPEAHVSDITHTVTQFDILSGALTIASAAPYWPAGTIHVVVVDPGVGSQRRAIASQSVGHFFIGPDNGVFDLIWRRARNTETREITDTTLFRHPVSKTFHGRDIFAPVAAHLASGTPFHAVGPAIHDAVRLAVPHPERLALDTVRGHVLKTDTFGNLITDLTQEWHPRAAFELHVGKHVISRLLTNYAEAEPGELFAIIGSSGFLEISAKQASAAAITASRSGDDLLLRTLA